MGGTIRYWAGAKAAAGIDEEPYVGSVLAAVLDDAARRREALRHVLPCCSFLVDGAPVGLRDLAGVDLPDGAVVEVLPPFAGG